MTRLIDADRLRERFESFNEIGATDGGGVSRPALSEANRRARDQLVQWFRELGLDVTIDEMGNVFGRLDTPTASGPPVLLGSHIDSQYRGGRYDGVIGVIGGLEVLESLTERDVELARPVELVAWSNEEGVRFQPDMMGSGVFAGVFDTAEMYARTDSDGTSFQEALEAIGYRGEQVCEPRDLHRYFELHVEQGPVLDDRDLSIGVVEGVFGFAWLRCQVRGRADHAGPTPMDSRRDALVTAADAIVAVRRLTATGGADLVGTVGELTVEPSSINVIPETVSFTVDLRSSDDAIVDSAVEQIRREIAHAAAREGTDVAIDELMRVPAAPFDPECIATIEEAAESVVGPDGYTRLVSGAGHDASYMTDLCPTGMIFVPSVDGVSHSEDEYTEWSDVRDGVAVLARAVAASAVEG